jgi:hypothetical protein
LIAKETTMPHPDLPIEGGCRCDRIRFRISAPPMLTMACHCNGCQRMTGSAFSTSIAVPAEGFEVIAGEPVIGGLHGDQSRHHHCDWCKSWLFTTITPDMGFVNVRATMLDDASWYVPFIETFTSEALPWAKTPAPHSYPAFPPMEEFGRLTAEFAAG